ncbi:gas vesicle protein [Streptomyces sp. NPDC056190]|uniref:gas vesicle protein GvpO n=1 Tax=Streptomyces sp. NPDC056190 TaxID=3345741 RepID=UPI0035D94478
MRRRPGRAARGACPVRRADRSDETVTSFEQTEDGWSLEVEVLELARVPDTMSLMAGYRVELDPQGQLTGYRRPYRYERGRADAHRSGGH